MPSRAHNQQQDSTINELNDKLDFLNTENRRLEEENKHAKVRLAGTAKVDNERDSLYLEVDALKDKNKLLKERLDASSHFQELENLRNEVRGKELEVQDLKNQVSSISKENAVLLTENERANQVKAAYSSDKKAFTEVLDRLSNERTALNDELGDLKGSYEKLMGEYKRGQDCLLYTSPSPRDS